MTCGPEVVRLRILDPAAHWSVDLAADGEAEVGQVIRLRPTAAELRAVIDAYFLPPALARGCGPCDWFLVTDESCRPRRRDPASRPGGGGWVRNQKTHLWRLAGDRWRAVRARACPLELARPVAVAASTTWLAVRDAGRAQILLLAPGAARIARSLDLAGEGPIALDRRGRVYAADGAGVIVFDRDGRQVRRIEVGAPVARLRTGPCGDLWIATDGPPPAVFRWDGAAEELRPVSGDIAAALAAALDPTGASLHDGGFCLTLPRGTDAPVVLCFDECGRPSQPPGPPGEAPLRTGTAATAPARPIDSGVARCLWHRVRLDAEVPAGTSIEVAVAATETPEAPHPDDWQRVGAAATDFLIDQPAGRYLHLRIALAARGEVSPVVRRIRLDFPRSTSAEWLPAVYRDAPESRDFLDRFLALFDAGVEDLDAAIERFPALLDASRADDQTLPWLASLLAVGLDPSWAPARRRELLLRTPELYRLRGTPDGVRRALEAVTGAVPAIEELGAPSPFGALARRGAAVASGGARVGEVRLFGRGRARARLGSSMLGNTQLRSYGDPDDDARTALAYRVRVQLPATAGTDADRLERLVAAQIPAHVVATVRVGARAPAVEAGAAVGIDTALVGLARPVLGRAGNIRLRKRSVLAVGTSRGGAEIAVGRGTAVGIQTILR